MCEKPFVKEPKLNKQTHHLSEYFLIPCGKCDECKIKSAKEWAHRIELEMKHYGGKAAFVTLTFNEEQLGSPDLQKRDVQLYLKRLRKSLGGREIKYYAVGEYGSLHLRKHYHLIIMNVDGTDYHGQLQRLKNKEPLLPTKDDWYFAHKAWDKGFADIQKPRGGVANYVSGYVAKIAKRARDIKEKGLQPEFRLMSKALGKREIIRIAEKFKQMNIKLDKPLNHLEYNGKYKKPLGRYLRQKFHEVLGKLEYLKQYNLVYNYKQLKKWAVNGISKAPETYLRLTQYERTAKFAMYKLKAGLI